MKLKPCKCGNLPVLKRVGDHKQYFVYGCPNCGYIAADYHEARQTEREAAKVWNRIMGGMNTVMEPEVVEKTKFSW